MGKEMSCVKKEKLRAAAIQSGCNARMQENQGKTVNIKETLWGLRVFSSEFPTYRLFGHYVSKLKFPSISHFTNFYIFFFRRKSSIAEKNAPRILGSSSLMQQKLSETVINEMWDSNNYYYSF